MTPEEELFYQAYDTVCQRGYSDEIEYVRNIKRFEDQDAVTFFQEYVWVVLNAGMKEQVARGIYDRYMEKLDIEEINHPGKRKGIHRATLEYETWFDGLQKAQDKIQFCESLPWIGPITKYHLARNIGIDTVKPDRHLVRLAATYGYDSPLKLCTEIQKTVGERLGVIDVILWRYCNLTTIRSMR
jgi:hypothetical protein